MAPINSVHKNSHNQRKKKKSVCYCFIHIFKSINVLALNKHQKHIFVSLKIRNIKRQIIVHCKNTETLIGKSNT